MTTTATKNKISEAFSVLAEAFKSGEILNTLAPVTAADMSEIETMVPEYLNENYAARLNLPTIYRFNQSGLRYYFTLKDTSVKFAPSVTTVIQEATPTSPGLQKIRDELGKDGYFAFMRERAHYGTLLHRFAADYLRNNRNFDTDTIPQRRKEYMEEENIRFDTHNWSYNLNKDLRSIAQFVHDCNVKPIAIELIGQYNGKVDMSLSSINKDGAISKSDYEKEICFSGAIDLLCEMTITEKGFFGEEYKVGDKKGQPKESKQGKNVIAIVDFKSGKNGFHPEHEMQLNMYKMMAEQSFGIKIDKLFNVSPKDWEGDTPTYNIKDQTDSAHAARIPFLLGAYFCMYPGVRDILIMNGKLNGGNMSDCTKWVSAEDWVLSKLGIQKKEQQKVIETALTITAPKNGNGKAKLHVEKDAIKPQQEFAENKHVPTEEATSESIQPTVADELHELAVKVQAEPVKLTVEEASKATTVKSAKELLQQLQNDRF